MDTYLKYLKKAGSVATSVLAPEVNTAKNIYSYFSKPSTPTGVQQPSQTAQSTPTGVPKPAPAIAKPLVTANPSAVSPAVKTPAAQAYIQSQASTPAPATTATPTPATGSTYTPTPGYVDSPGSPSSTGNPSMDAYIGAYKKYIDAQTNSSELTDARKYLNQLVLDDKKAREKALNSGETMGFAGGEEARVARNNSFAIDAATNNVNSLEADRENTINSAKGGADLTKDLLGFARDDTKTAYQMEQDKAKATTDAAKTKFEQEMATKKFDEDVRQFGIETALKNRQIRIDEIKAGTNNGTPAGVNGAIDANLTTQPGYKALTQKQKTQADSLNNLVRTLNEYKAYYAEHPGAFGGAAGNIVGQDAGVLQTKINSIIFAAAQAEGTGALQQADREVIEKIIPNPTSIGGAFGTLFHGGATGNTAKIDDQINKYTNNLAGYGLRPTSAGATAPPAGGTSGVTSSGLKYTITP